PATIQPSRRPKGPRLDDARNNLENLWNPWNPWNPWNLFPHHVLRVFVVFLANALDELDVRLEAPTELDVPGFRVGLRIVDRDVDLHLADRLPCEPLDDAQRLGAGQPAHVEPRPAVLTDCLDDQRVALPFADRIAHPRRLGVLRQGAAVEEDLAVDR